ncbi:MAG: hypothetical protein ACIAS6_00445 [Phycisphaerales bacterium JB060]
MSWIGWVIVVALVVFALRNIWTAYEALTQEPKQGGRAGIALLFLAIDVFLILYITGAIP